METTIGDVQVEISRDWQMTVEKINAPAVSCALSIFAATVMPLLALILMFNLRSRRYAADSWWPAAYCTCAVLDDAERPAYRLCADTWRMHSYFVLPRRPIFLTLRLGDAYCCCWLCVVRMPVLFVGCQHAVRR